MFERLRKLWKCSADQAEHIIRTNENHARLVVSRRSFFSASAVALAAPTTLVSLPPTIYRLDLVSAYPLELILKLTMNGAYGKFGWFEDFEHDVYAFEIGAP